jgi:hypothetical protein
MHIRIGSLQFKKWNGSFASIDIDLHLVSLSLSLCSYDDNNNGDTQLYLVMYTSLLFVSFFCFVSL